MLDLKNLSQKRLVMGFDGFIDRPARLPDISTMAEFANWLNAREGSSGALDFRGGDYKIGGNMPIMANALATLGGICDCVGAVSDPLFSSMHENCKLYPVCAPGTCIALEFKSGKLMLSDNRPIENLDFKSICAAIPNLKELYEKADLWAFLNWSELPHMSNIMRAFLDEIVITPEKIIFFDLSDPSTRSESDLLGALDLISKFAKRATAVLSLNDNEANILAKTLDCPNDAENLLKKSGASVLMIRHLRRAYAASNKKTAEIAVNFIEKPKLLTGAGDNFNAGFAAGLLLGAELEDALILGTNVSSYYILSAKSPNQEELLRWTASCGQYWK